MELSLWDFIFVAGALVLIFEGFLPFLSPAVWRSIFERAIQLRDGQIRFYGLISMLLGCLLLFLFLP